MAKVLRTLREWLFYGHVWIALAAAGLGGLSICLAIPGQSRSGFGLNPILALLFLATLGVYTLHRLISFRRAGSLPLTRRYRIVREHPLLSLVLGVGSMIVALFALPGTLLAHTDIIWPSLIFALPVTVFYLIPPAPGWRRLRDLPFLKVVLVATAWTFVTHDLPLRLAGAMEHGLTTGGFSEAGCWEYAIRFLFTLTIALLFDNRDLELDRRQGVRTVANTYPRLLPYLSIALLLVCGILAGLQGPGLAGGVLQGLALPLTYWLMAPVAWWTCRQHGEDWYAVVVNGLLLVPSLVGILVLDCCGFGG